MNNVIAINGVADIEVIKQRIYEVRGLRVMLDYDLAELYEVDVAQLKRQVRRNIERFPEDFMFELTHDEQSTLRCQNGILKNGRGQHSKYLPFAFTEEGVAMLSGILRSQTAVQVNINIMRAFVAIRHAVAGWQDTNLRVEQLSHKVDNLNARVDEILHEQQSNNMEMAVQIDAINEALDQLRAKDAAPRKRIGFKQ